MGDILKAVRTQTNASIELPGNAPERVVGRFGPGPARDVLTSLLNGSHFNYLLLGSSTDPNALDRVILTAKSGVSAESNPQPPSPEATAYNQSVYNRPTATPMAAPNTTTVEGQDAQDEASDDSADAADDAQTDDSADQADEADDQQAGEETQQQGQAGQPDGQPSVKTPEQLLQQLQQRQQQIQQQGGQPGAPGLAGPPHN